MAWKKLTGLLTVSVWLAASLSAADETLETGFKLRQPEDYSAWQITFGFAKVKPKETPKEQSEPVPDAIPEGVRSVTCTITRPLWREEVLDTQGKKIDFWYDGRTVFYKTNRDEYLRLADATSPQKPVMSGRGFRGLEWANEKTFVGRQKLETRQCLVFAKDESKLWVDANTHYPVRWQKGMEVRDYLQLPEPTKMLVMPDDVAREAAAMEHDLEIYKRPVPKLGRKKS